MTLSRRSFTRGALAASALAAAPFRPARAQMPPVKIGSLLPRSGFEAFIGKDCQYGLEVAETIIKDMGYSFEVVDADTESNPQTARTQAERLIREGCHMLMGSFDSAQTFALAQVAEEHGIPMVVNIGADPAITEQGYKFVFRNFPTAPMFGDNGMVLFDQLFKITHATPKTAVLTYVNDSFGEATRKAVLSYRDRFGLPFKIVEQIGYSPQTNDLSVEVAKAKAAKPDLQIVIHRLNDIIIMVREMVKQRYQPMGIISPGSPGMQFPQFFKALGKYANYCITNQPWLDPKQPLAHRFQTAFYKAHPDYLCGLEQGFMFEGLLVCVDAYKRAQSTKPEALVQALRATHITDRVMVGGAITFDAKGQNVHLPSASVENLKGKPTVVLPLANAEAKPVFPMPRWF
jgi:branched-chain amino acid transport system substrate-binding protein